MRTYWEAWLLWSKFFLIIELGKSVKELQLVLHRNRVLCNRIFQGYVSRLWYRLGQGGSPNPVQSNEPWLERTGGRRGSGWWRLPRGRAGAPVQSSLLSGLWRHTEARGDVLRGHCEQVDGASGARQARGVGRRARCGLLFAGKNPKEKKKTSHWSMWLLSQ